jgi:hypothetical protein
VLEIAGLVMSGIGLVSDLFGTYKDLTAWSEQDLQVDGKWLDLALQKGVLEGQASDFLWSREEKGADPRVERDASGRRGVQRGKESQIPDRTGPTYDRSVLMKRTAGG